MLELDSPIQYLKGVGPKLAEKLKRLNIETPANLLDHIPRTYIDFSKPLPIKSLRIGEIAVIHGKITDLQDKRTPRKRMSIIEFLIDDGTANIKAVFFNQPFLKDVFSVGKELYFYGKVSYDFQAQMKCFQSPMSMEEPRILPIYPETAGVTSRYLNKLVTNSLELGESTVEFLPEEIVKSSKLISKPQAFRYLHQPKNLAETDLGRRRMGFEEIYLTALQSQIYRSELKKKQAPKINILDEDLKVFVDKLPFKLTNSQRKAAWEIICDLKGNTNIQYQTSNIQKKLNTTAPMNRLLNGDVGSGKTVVAAMAVYACAKSGYQVVLMAPTEILAFQHYETLKETLAKFDITIGLATSSRKQISAPVLSSSDLIRGSRNSRRPLDSRLRGNDTEAHVDLLIGTHALLEDKIPFHNTALIIVDEQHRFGVGQRNKLGQKSKASWQKKNTKGDSSGSKLPTTGLVSHFLSMTATPIPRTLQLTLYGDLDVSIIDEMPKGRKLVETRVITDSNRQNAYDKVVQEIQKDHQAFIICPLIESNQETEADSTKTVNQSLFENDRKTVMAEYKKLKNEIFPDFRIGFLHGRLKPKEKSETMNKFNKGDLDILISTSVVEVGVNVPNATVMMIEDAERFGLAQLHQFRGRVGRSSEQAYCFLMSNSLNRPTKRLLVMEHHSSGFELAEIDLEIRGPGQIYGKEQSGFANLRLELVSDIFLLSEARDQAKKTLELYHDINQLPELQKKLDEKFETFHSE